VERCLACEAVVSKEEIMTRTLFARRRRTEQSGVATPSASQARQRSRGGDPYLKGLHASGS